MTDQQVVFMNPQNENLDHLYDLIHQICRQMDENKQKRARLLRDVDVLANQLNARSGNENIGDANIPVISDFIARRDHTAASTIGVESTRIGMLRKQNDILRKMLRNKCLVNNETLNLLKIHEEYLSDAVTLLRQDVLSYRQDLVQRCRSLYEDGLIPLEDREFDEYLLNVMNIQELLDLSSAFRALLRET
ncbi:LAFE_0B07426g1_1 [Lachancea fermentati]|uniref:LAFE_0B07426g1_1 n=1 Tax=Lachancea fermentati TaxID=4955 RepID=A0A1G4M8D0_LACFM|nr:LAFE_0B07426g1_1 [Lachancea fermentati]